MIRLVPFVGFLRVRAPRHAVIGMLTALSLTAGTGTNAYCQQQNVLDNRIKPTDIKVTLGAIGPKFTYADVVLENTSIYTVASMTVSVYLDRSIPCAGFYVESQDIDCAHHATAAHTLHFAGKDGKRGGLRPRESVTFRIPLDDWAKEKDTVGVVLRPTVHWVRAVAGTSATPARR